MDILSDFIRFTAATQTCPERGKYRWSAYSTLLYEIITPVQAQVHYKAKFKVYTRNVAILTSIFFLKSRLRNVDIGNDNN